MLSGVVPFWNAEGGPHCTCQKQGTKFSEKTIDFDPITLKMTEANISLKDQVKLLKSQGIADKDIILRFPKKHGDTVKRYLRDLKVP